MVLPLLRGLRNTVGNLIEMFWLKQAFHGPRFIGIRVNNRVVLFHRIRDFKQYYFNSSPPTSQGWLSRPFRSFSASRFAVLPFCRFGVALAITITFTSTSTFAFTITITITITTTIAITTTSINIITIVLHNSYYYYYRFTIIITNIITTTSINIITILSLPSVSRFCRAAFLADAAFLGGDHI